METIGTNEVKTNFCELTGLFPKAIFGKEALARACGVTKSAIETHFKNVSAAAFAPRADGQKACPDTLLPGERQEMLALVVIIRFAAGQLGSDLRSLSGVAAKVRAIRALPREVVAEVAKLAISAVEEASLPRDITPEEVACMDAKPSLRRMSVMLGQSSSAMTARMKRVRSKHPGLSDRDVVSKIWFEEVRPKIADKAAAEPPDCSMRNKRNEYLRFLSDLLEEVPTASLLARYTIQFECFADSLADLIRHDIADEVEQSSGGNASQVIRDAIATVFDRYGLYSTNTDQVFNAYYDVVVCGGAVGRIAYEVERAIDQHATWEAFLKTLEDDAMNALLAEVGRPRGKTCGALNRFAG